jgi:hypothetical protein
VAVRTKPVAGLHQNVPPVVLISHRVPPRYENGGFRTTTSYDLPRRVTEQAARERARKKSHCPTLHEGSRV